MEQDKRNRQELALALFREHGVTKATVVEPERVILVSQELEDGKEVQFHVIAIDDGKDVVIPQQVLSPHLRHAEAVELRAAEEAQKMQALLK